MSLMCMPWIVINLGGEMLYVLEQRLKAQSVSAGKTARVLQDVVACMFDRAFLEDRLFVPQETYSMASTKRVFERLAHASIMRLSESSMEKLFDLMVMGAKYQLMCCTSLAGLLQITQRHLRNMHAMVGAAVATADLVAHTEGLARTFYGRLPDGQLALLRHSLLRFFQDRRVRVSLLLTEGVQAPSGTIILPPPWRAPDSGGGGAASPDPAQRLSSGGAPIGRVRVFGPAGALLKEACEPLAALTADPAEFFCHPVPLGENLYAPDRPKVAPPPRRSWSSSGREGNASAGAAEQQSQRREANAEAMRATHEEPHKDPTPSEGAHRAVQEIDLLAGLVKGGPGANDGDNFRLQLFGPDDGAATPPTKPEGSGTAAAHVSGGTSAAGTSGDARRRELEFGAVGGAAARNEAYRRRLMAGELFEDDGPPGGGRPAGGAAAENDILSLMENAGLGD